MARTVISCTVLLERSLSGGVHAFLGVLADFTKVFPNYVVFQISTSSLILRINFPVFRVLL